MYPVSYAYDDFDAVTNMTTWHTGFAAGAPAPGDTTAWLRDEATDLLLQKIYPDNTGPSPKALGKKRFAFTKPYADKIAMPKRRL